MAGDARYVGRIMGDTMQGTVTSGGKTVQWTATRVGGMAKAIK
jgi:hypothetical protein